MANNSKALLIPIALCGDRQCTFSPPVISESHLGPVKWLNLCISFRLLKEKPEKVAGNSFPALSTGKELLVFLFSQY